MNARDQGRNELDAALAALERVSAYVDGGRASFDASTDRQLALVFLWANIGSQLKQYCRIRDVPPGTEPFAGPIQMRDRLVYGSVLTLDSEVVWHTCVIDGPALRELIDDIRSAL